MIVRPSFISLSTLRCVSFISFSYPFLSLVFRSWIFFSLYLLYRLVTFRTDLTRFFLSRPVSIEMDSIRYPRIILSPHQWLPCLRMWFVIRFMHSIFSYIFFWYQFTYELHTHASICVHKIHICVQYIFHIDTHVSVFTRNTKCTRNKARTANKWHRPYESIEKKNVQVYCAFIWCIK